MLSRSVFGVVPDAASWGSYRRGPALNCYEKTISAVENPPQTATRISQPQFQQERQSDLAQPPKGWAQAIDARLNLAGRPMAADSSGRFRFGRNQRIKQGRDFRRMRQDGERLTIGCLIANWQRLNPPATSRLGVVTSSRIGNAVVRNRARRLLRESFRLHQDHLAQPVDLVLVARASIADKRFADVERDFLTYLRKAGLLKRVSGT
jgi:ribonuclease P protein component